jgi:PKD repeat protein
MLGATVEGFRFFSNITYKRHASFARVTMDSGNFEMWNREHLDCDDQPTSAPPYSVHIYPRKVEGIAPFNVMLCAVPNDFATLTTYQWSVNGGQQIGNMISTSFTKPGVYRVRVDAKYIDIGASDEITVVVKAPEVKGDDPPPPVETNEPPVVQINSDKLSVRQKKGVLTFNALAEDEDGEIQSIVWDFGDGTTGEGTTVHKTWRRNGSYTVTVRVRDDDGAEASASVTVQVTKKKTGA